MALFMEQTKVISLVDCNRKSGPLRLGALVCILVATLHPARAVVFYSSGDPAYNTTEPSGQLADSGWQLQGQWGQFLGTPISSNLFVTAKHVGGNVGDTFLFRGTAFHTHLYFDDPDSDLRVWQVCGVFPEWASLYDKSDESGKSSVIFGRGRQRGAGVHLTGGVGGELKGWEWGPDDGVMRWGQNTVSSLVTPSGTSLPPGSGTSTSALVRFQFNSTGGANEAALSGGDSGGGVFILVGATWKLAGINYAVDGPFSRTGMDQGFLASLFDVGGFYTGGEGNWAFNLDLPTDKPGSFYATRIYSRLDWLTSVVNSLAGLMPVPLVESASGLGGTWSVEIPTGTDPAQQTITVSKPAMSSFFRMHHCAPLRISSTVVVESSVVLSYEFLPPPD